MAQTASNGDLRLHKFIIKPMDEEKPAEEKKTEASKAAAEGGKKETEAPPPQEIVLKVIIHCEGCAMKVRRCLKGFKGVDNVITDCIASKVVMKGERADPTKYFKRIQQKSHRHVELISLIPKSAPPSEESQKLPEKKRGHREEGRDNRRDSRERLHSQPPSREENRGVVLGLSGRGGEDYHSRRNQKEAASSEGGEMIEVYAFN